MVESKGAVAPEADDLFGRWLAHHTQQAVGSDPDPTVDDQVEPADEPVVIPAGPAAPDPVMERSNEGFEPVIMPSVRKKREQVGEPKRGILRRQHDEGADTHDGDEAIDPDARDTEVSIAAGPLAVVEPVVNPVRVEPMIEPVVRGVEPVDPPLPAPRPRPSRPSSGVAPDWLKDLRETTARPAAPDPAPAAVPARAAVVPTSPAAPSVVIPTVAPRVKPRAKPGVSRPIGSATTPVPAPTPSVAAAAAPPVAAPAVAAPAGATPAGDASAVAVAPISDLEWLKSLRDPHGQDSAPPAPAPHAPLSPTEPKAPGRASIGTSAATTTAATTGKESEPTLPDPYAFKPRRATRRFVALVFTASVVVSALLARSAYLEPDQTSVALAATAAFGAAVLWAILATTTITTLTVHHGKLEINRNGSREIFDLRSDVVPVTFVGAPGRAGWKAIFVRRGLPPFVIDSSIVDPVDFVRVVAFHRPDPTL